MNYKSKRSKACAIPVEVKQKVFLRDNGRCIFCGYAGFANAHFVARSQGGLGIEENIITACTPCHMAMDNSDKRSVYKERAENYLRSIYPDWNEERLVYQKWEEPLLK